LTSTPHPHLFTLPSQFCKASSSSSLSSSSSSSHDGSIMSEEVAFDPVHEYQETITPCGLLGKVDRSPQQPSNGSRGLEQYGIIHMDLCQSRLTPCVGQLALVKKPEGSRD